MLHERAFTERARVRLRTANAAGVRSAGTFLRALPTRGSPGFVVVDFDDRHGDPKYDGTTVHATQLEPAD